MQRFARLGLLFGLAAVPAYIGLTLLGRFGGGPQWPLPSPFFLVAWFIVASWITISEAPREELRQDDGMSKAVFALGAANLAAAFFATLFSAT